MQQKRYIWALVFLGVIYLLNMRIEIMEVDAAQYASISLEMMESGSFLEVYHRGDDYLDKPPLLFWLSALSFQIFGVNELAYKLPSVMVLLLGLYALFRFTRMWYDKETALLATTILGFTQAFFLITNDVRTDGLLTGWVIFAVWQLSSFIRSGSWGNLILGSLGVGLAMMTKGPIGLILPGAAIGADLLLKRQWKVIFHPQWLIFLLIVGASLIPMCIGLYQQFDLHPEKEVYGLEGPSGLEFFFWTQSFGRITGDIYWDNGAPSYYFFLTMLWDFQPWVLFFFPAWGIGLYRLVLSKFRVADTAEYMSLGGFTLGFLMLSLSNFKLPHYVFPLFPFAAILTARYILQLNGKLLQRLSYAQWGLMQIFALAVGAYFILGFPDGQILLPLVCLGLLGLAWWIWLKEQAQVRLLTSTLLVVFMLNLVMTVDFYPKLLSYQATNQVGRKVLAAQKAQDQFFFYKVYGQGLDFYAQRINQWVDWGKIPSYPPGTWILTNEEGLSDIEGMKTHYRIIETYYDYNVTSIKLPFLLAASREEMLKPLYLLEKEAVSKDE
ncbi:MAG: glycosyltransferase family 39 protein [Bacteroidota bacterium]